MKPTSGHRWLEAWIPDHPMLNKEHSACVYALVCHAEGKRYIGSAEGLEKRIKHHYKMLIRGQHDNHKLQTAWNTFGADSFTWEVLERCSPAELESAEKRQVERYGFDNLYNIDRNIQRDKTRLKKHG